MLCWNVKKIKAFLHQHELASIAKYFNWTYALTAIMTYLCDTGPAEFMYEIFFYIKILNTIYYIDQNIEPLNVECSFLLNRSGGSNLISFFEIDTYIVIVTYHSVFFLDYFKKIPFNFY